MDVPDKQEWERRAELDGSSSILRAALGGQRSPAKEVAHQLQTSPAATHLPRVACALQKKTLAEPNNCIECLLQ